MTPNQHMRAVIEHPRFRGLWRSRWEGAGVTWSITFLDADGEFSETGDCVNLDDTIEAALRLFATIDEAAKPC